MCLTNDFQLLKRALKMIAEFCPPTEIVSISKEALRESAWNDASEILKSLLRGSRFEQEIFLDAFELCCMSGSTNATRALLEHKKHYTGQFQILCDGIVTSSGHGYVDIVHLLVSRIKGSPSVYYKTP